MSYRSDNLASYDRSLLSSVPGPTRAEKQEGYNVDLLEEGRDRRAPSPPTNGAASDHNGTLLDYSPGAMSYARKDGPTTTTNDYEPIEKRVPWYRTRKGIIGIVMALLVIIAAAVGGGVGGTRHSSKSASSNNATTTSGVGQSASNGTEQGVGESNSTSTSTLPPSSNTLGQVATLAPTQTRLPVRRNGGRGVA
ncbi:hypothetical protein BJY52DRAFT_1185294 [Lactarius psammicola]|nr:hypothetical protein BJY52DRAFT_1185294 [Lactarius psammicola]